MPGRPHGWVSPGQGQRASRGLRASGWGAPRLSGRGRAPARVCTHCRTRPRRARSCTRARTHARARCTDPLYTCARAPAHARTPAARLVVPPAKVTPPASLSSVLGPSTPSPERSKATGSLGGQRSKGHRQHHEHREHCHLETRARKQRRCLGEGQGTPSGRNGLQPGTEGHRRSGATAGSKRAARTAGRGRPCGRGAQEARYRAFRGLRDPGPVRASEAPPLSLCPVETLEPPAVSFP